MAINLGRSGIAVRLGGFAYCYNRYCPAHALVLGKRHYFKYQRNAWIRVA